MKKESQATLFGIVGLGRFGTALAQTLAKAGKDVIVIDKNESLVREARQYTDYAYVANSLNIETLREIGLQNCDVVVVCIGERIDASILTTMSVIKMGVPVVMSKAISSEHGMVLEKIGARVIYPEKDMALWLGRKLTSKNLLDIVTLDNNVEIRTIKVPEHLIGKSVEEIQIRRRYGLNIIAIENREKTTTDIVPSSRFVPEDMIIVIGDAEKMDQFEDSIDD